ncbi:hypothetical protein NEF87_004904 [Candidatus Lokiarchaeum ossiferum]|uniref:DUF2357 domain-containing protein n=1 Tax=Candidatus Lokiarchaeum ossiferum TaxID=2951803 RepID=A0ABY6I1D2_9ARCH|nr:hypothetical protein NEF87_004904 [Candidatus Lokiarchaeum sp. B-35]
MPKENIITEQIGLFKITENEFWFNSEGLEYIYPILEVNILIERPKYEGPYLKIIYKDGNRQPKSLQGFHSRISVAFERAYDIHEKRLYFKLIQELLSELQPNDEILLEEAIKIVREEFKLLNYKRRQIQDHQRKPRKEIRDNYFETLFRFIDSNIPEFEYVRLKRTIRIKSDISKVIKEIDTLFEEWESNPKNFKNRE